MAASDTVTPGSIGDASRLTGGDGASDVFAAVSQWGWDELEIRIWLWMLPSMPIRPKHDAGVAAAAEAEATEPASYRGSEEAVLNFFADLVVTASRRPQVGLEALHVVFALFDLSVPMADITHTEIDVTA